VNAEGLQPQGPLSIMVVARDGIIAEAAPALAPLRGTSLLDQAAPGVRQPLARWLRTAVPPGPLSLDTTTFAYRGRGDDGLPVLMNLTAVEPLAGRPVADDEIILVRQRVGGPVVPIGDRTVTLAPRQGWDHVLNHDVRAGIRNARSFVGLYRRQRRAADGGSDPSDRGGDAPPDPALLDTGLRALANADRAMEDIVRFYRLDVDPLTMGPVRLAGITVGAARRAAEELDRLARADHADLAGGTVVHGPGDADPLMVTGNEALLEWLLTELVVNARKFAGGATVVAVTGTEAGGWVTVRVANTGTPIDRSLAEEAFGLGRVLQGRGARPGVGLGLPLARRIAARHAGRLDVVTRPGGSDESTVVELELPAATPVPAPPDPGAVHGRAGGPGDRGVRSARR
jgi:signal transduction histidine kinase